MQIDGKNYYVQQINFHQLDKLFELFPNLMATIQSPSFKPADKVHVIYALTKMLQDNPMSKLASLLLVPEEADGWKPEFFESNMKIAGLLPLDALFTIEEESIEAGELVQNFFASNPTLDKLLQNLKGYLPTAAVPTEEADSQDTQQASEQPTE